MDAESLILFVLVPKVKFGNYIALIFSILNAEYYNNYTSTRRREIHLRRNTNS